MAGTAVRGRLTWQTATVGSVTDETPKVRTLSLEVPDWPGHRAGQHVDIRLTADDGYQAERAYSIAAAPGEPLAITVERLDDGEVSPYLTEDLQPGDSLEVRGPIGGYFVWEPAFGGPLLLLAGGSGVVPLRSMLRCRASAGSSVPARLLYSSRSFQDVIYRAELDDLSDGVEVIHALTRIAAAGVDGLRPAGGSADAGRSRLACGAAAAGLRLRADELRGGGRLRSGRARVSGGAGQDRTVRRHGAVISPGLGDGASSLVMEPHGS